MSSYSYQHINTCLSRYGLPRMLHVSKSSPLVTFLLFSHFCAHENVSLCFTSWAFINHSSALCFVTDNITATSWQREDERTERQREKEYFFPLFFFSFAATISFVLESENWTSEHPQLPWRVNGLVLWLGRNDLRNEEAKQTQKKNGTEKKQHPQTECL